MKLKFPKKDIGTLLKRYKYWTLYLSSKQNYLGRLRLILNRKNSNIDLTELSKPELQELFKIIKISQKALIKCFQPDLFNYATLRNCIRHHHWHIVPRYKSIRKINEVVFKDKKWNKPIWPDKPKKLSKKTLNLIYSMILKEL